MSDEVAVADEIESSPAVPETAEATPSSEDIATLKKRLAGKDQALTRTQAERDALKAEREALSKWKAEREEADLSEVEKLQRRLAEFEQRAAEAEARAERIRLASDYPLAVEAFGDDPLPSEERLAALQQRLAATTATDEDESEAPVNPNRPRRAEPVGKKPIDKMSQDELRAEIRRQSTGLGSLNDIPSFGH